MEQNKHGVIDATCSRRSGKRNIDHRRDGYVNA